MNVMRTLKTFILVLGTILATFTMYSCLDDDSNSPNNVKFIKARLSLSTPK